jgi:hypothetical protein
VRLRTPARRLLILGTSDLFASAFATISLQHLVAQADKIVDDAMEAANQSIYERDVEACGGMRLISIVVDDWEELQV